MVKVKEGEMAPDFELPNQNGETHSLSRHRGEWILLYFYPKDDTPGCTKEACGIRDAYADFKENKIKVFGVSVDSIESHGKFAEKYHLPFTLLSDADKKVVNEYGVYGRKKFMGREYQGTMRTSFLINPEGRVAKIYKDVNPEAHTEEILRDFRTLQKAPE